MSTIITSTNSIEIYKWCYNFGSGNITSHYRLPFFETKLKQLKLYQIQVQIQVSHRFVDMDEQILEMYIFLAFEIESHKLIENMSYSNFHELLEHSGTF